MSRRLMVLGVGVLSWAMTGCGPSSFPVFRGGAFAQLERRAPLEDGERALDEPAADTTLLGQIIKEPFDPARRLADQTSENPCASELLLSTREASAIASTVDAERTRGAYFFYRVRILRRAIASERDGYAKCCAEKGCGVGYVRSLAFGDGEEGFASETLPGGRADVALDDPGAPLELEVGNARKVHGWIAFGLEGGRALVPPEPPRPIADADYLADKFEVRDVPGSADQYLFCTATDCVSENGFVQRYRERTGAHELDDFDRDRAREARISGAVTTVLGIASLALGAATLATADEGKTRDEQDGNRIAGGVGLGAGIVATALGLALLIEPRDGSPLEHFISKSDARRFVARFNRALVVGKEPPRTPAAAPPKAPEQPRPST
ncbi:MAG: hypothetical protein U0414_09615 [Polyangiaceae bacterium]